jgi:lipopolysaccharide transport system ATP-binding protein
VIAIQIENVGKRYRLGEIGRRSFFSDWKRKLLRQPEPEDGPGTFWALRDLNFDVMQGEVVGVIGHNGAGKSTLLKILSSITSPTTGVVRLRGRVASLLEVGTGFHQDLTGRENVYLNGAIMGMTRREVSAKFDEIVAFSEMGGFIDTPVKRYSSGMRVRLAFAVAAHLEPEILIVDEVLAVGDAAFQQRCVGKMGEVSRSGRTVLFVSHNAAAVENLCTRGVVLNRGRLQFDGTPHEALQQYAKSIRTHGSDLSGRTDHGGSGEIVITKLEFRDLEGRETRAIASGSAAEIWLHYECRSAADYSRLCCEITVKTQSGAPVFNQSNWFTGDEFGRVPVRGAFVCRLPELPLPEGSYRLDYGLYPRYRRRVPLDTMSAAAELTVLQSDYFGGGKVPDLADGVCLVRGSWRVAGS